MSTKILIRENGRETGSWELEQFRKSSVLLGRSSSCDIKLHSDFVSGRHAVFRKKGDGWIIEDESSTNGIFYKDTKITSKEIYQGLKLVIRGQKGDEKYVAELLFKVTENHQTEPKKPEQVEVINQKSIEEIEQLTVAEENHIASMSSSKLDNFLRGEGFRKEDVILTSKRLVYIYEKGLLNSEVGRSIVDVREVTGTKVVKSNRWWLLIFGGLFLLLGIIFSLAKGKSIDHSDMNILNFMFDMEAYSALNIIGRHMICWAIIFAIVYFFTYGRHLRVEYPGGVVNLTLKKYSYQEILDLQDAIFEAKRQGLLGNYKVKFK